MQQLILGSSSPWRAAVLRRKSLPFIQMSPDIDEKAIRFDDSETLTLAIAEAKSRALIGRIPPGSFLVTSDQVTVYNGEIREKPVSEAQAHAWLSEYRNSDVETVTAVVVRQQGWNFVLAGIDRAGVRFGDLPCDDIRRAIKRGDVLESCGALTHEDPDIARSIVRIVGTTDSLDGLPFDLTLGYLEALGYRRPS